jgi:hypothetical protein
MLVRKSASSVDPMETEYIILKRMMADADKLCRTDDAFMLGQYRHLRGRVAALIEMTRPARVREGA